VEGVEGEPVNLTPAVAEAISAGFALFLVGERRGAMWGSSVCPWAPTRAVTGADTQGEGGRRSAAGE